MVYVEYTYVCSVNSVHVKYTWCWFGIRRVVYMFSVEGFMW